MISIKNIFSRLFGNSGNRNNHPGNWEDHYKKQQEEFEKNLKTWVPRTIREKSTIDFSWESGNDEAILTFPGINSFEDEKYQDLELYLINKLEIPDAGEFSMSGQGTLYILNNMVRAKYSSVMRDIADYDEEKEEEIYEEEEIVDSGDRELFSANE